MSNAHILVIADTAQAVETLADRLLPDAGYTVTVADDMSPPPPDIDLILLDVTQLRGSPFAKLHVQRSMGLDAPALLHAPRLTGEMAADLFELNIVGFIRKPIPDEELLAELEDTLNRVLSHRDEESLRLDLETMRASFTRRLEELNVLSRIGRAITSVTDLDEVLSRLVEATVYLTDASQCVLYLYDDESDSLRLRAQHGLNDQEIDEALYPSPDADASQIFQSAKLLRREKGDDGKVSTDFLIENAIHTPIVVGKTTIGVLSVHRDENIFEDADEIVLNSLADYAAIAIDKASFAQQNAEHIQDALVAARNVRLHAETLFDPIDGIESNADTLLSGGFDPLTEQQHSAVTRIKRAADRMKEIAGFIRAELAEFQDDVTD